MNPHVIVVYECVLIRSAKVLLQFFGKASDLYAVSTGFNSLLDSFL